MRDKDVELLAGAGTVGHVGQIRGRSAQAGAGQSLHPRHPAGPVAAAQGFATAQIAQRAARRVVCLQALPQPFTQGAGCGRRDHDGQGGQGGQEPGA